MPKLDTKKPILTYNPSSEESKIIKRLQHRIFNELKPARQTHISTEEGKSIESIWRDADRLFPPHRYHSTALDDWQSRNSQPNPYSKIMTALSTVIAHNPEVALRASMKEYEAKTNLIKALYSHSWKTENSGQQLKLFTFNLGKYGFSIGRTYHRKLTRKMRDIVFINPETEEKRYEEKEIDDPNGVYFQNMNVWNCWIDDMALPGDMWSVRDWAWREVYSYDTFLQRFPKEKFNNIGAVQIGGNTEPDDAGIIGAIARDFTTKDLVEVYFYENQEMDEFYILANNILITPVISPLPYKHKRLSCTFTQWTPRDATSIYGIGIIEALREDQETLDKIRNMSIDELVLSIYQMFFHGPSTNFSEGKLRIAPGRLIQVTNPADVTPVKFQPPSADSVRWIELIEKSMDESTGITKALSGEFIGKTAFEVQQNKEAGLRKLKIPISNIEWALTIEARNHIDLIQQVMSVPVDIRRIVGNKKYEEYLLEAQNNPDLYFLKGDTLFRYREVRLNLEDQGQKGFQPSKTTNSFILTSEAIRWEGEIEIQAQSTLVRSVEVERQLKLDLFNIVGRLPTISIEKATRKILKAYDEDPDEWTPTREELVAKQRLEQLESRRLPVESIEGGSEFESVVPRSETEVNESSLNGGILSASQTTQ